MTFVFYLHDLSLMVLLVFMYGKAMQSSGRDYEAGQSWVGDAVIAVALFAVLVGFFIAGLDTTVTMGQQE
jgi:hypothetical protein